MQRVVRRSVLTSFTPFSLPKLHPFRPHGSWGPNPDRVRRYATGGTQVTVSGAGFDAASDYTCRFAAVIPSPLILNPTPSTLNPQPSTSNPEPSTLNINPQP